MNVYIENGEANPAVKIQDTAPAGFTESNTISSWDRYGQANGHDFKYIRAKIATIAAATGFSNLSESEKVIASKYYAVSKADQDTVHTQTELDELAIYYHENSILSRAGRFKRASAYAFVRLTIADRQAISAELQSQGLGGSYVEFGIEGVSSGDIDGLYDYIEATNGYAAGQPTEGIAAKGITPTLGTLTELVTNMMDTLKGNY